MITKEEIELFLKEFKIKLNIYDIIYREERRKNIQTLLDLDITPAKRTEIIKNLTLTDFSEGAIQEKLYKGSDMWVFGKKIKDKEIYIKITLGMMNNFVICISFHLAEHQMNYPFK